MAFRYYKDKEISLQKNCVDQIPLHKDFHKSSDWHNDIIYHLRSYSYFTKIFYYSPVILTNTHITVTMNILHRPSRIKNQNYNAKCCFAYSTTFEGSLSKYTLSCTIYIIYRHWDFFSVSSFTCLTFRLIVLSLRVHFVFCEPTCDEWVQMNRLCRNIKGNGYRN